MALVLGLLIAGGFLLILVPTVYLYRDPDSSFYLEAARRLLAGDGLTVSAGLEKLPATTEPLALWPPGYPLAVAGVSALTGIDPFWVAPALSWLSWALVPAALMFTLEGLLKVRSILLVAALAMVSPGAIDFAWQPMTDLPFLLLSILSFGLLVRGSGDPERLALIVLAGFVAGLAYAVRNAGVALAAGVAGGYALMVLLRLTSFRRAGQALICWSAGFGVVAVPLLIRNLTVFGALQPYRMEPSSLGLVANLRYLAAATLNDLVAVHGLIDALVWRNALLILAGLGAAAALWRLRRGMVAVWRPTPAPARAAAMLLLSYAAATAAVVVLARTRYQWGEFIGLRHVLQFDCILLAAGAAVLERVPIRLRRLGMATGLVTALLALRASYALDEVVMARREAAAAPDLSTLMEIRSDYRFRLAVKRSIARDAPLLAAIRAAPAGTVLASNYDDVLRVGTGRVAHTVNLAADCDMRRALRLSQRGPPPEMRLLLFARRDLIASGCWARLKQADKRPGAVARSYLVHLDAEELRALLG